MGWIVQLLQWIRSYFKARTRYKLWMSLVGLFLFSSLHVSQGTLATHSTEAELAVGDQGVPAALVCQGLMPCALFSPKLVIST
jgi:hypothetical protein